MAERSLTAPEIDSLLAIFRGGRSARRRDAEVQSFDVNQPSRVPRGAFTALRIRHQQAARQMAQELKAVLGISLQVTLKDFEQVVFDSWRRRLPEPCCAFIVEMAPLKEPAVLVMDHHLAFAVIDRLLGGRGEGNQKVRDLTGTESSVLEEVLSPIVRAHVAAWQPYLALRGRILRPVFVPRFIREIADKDVVLGASYRLEGLGEASHVLMALGTSGLEPHLQHEPRPELSAEDCAAWRQRIALRLAGAPVGCSVRLGGTEVGLRQLIELETGDVLVLDQPIVRPLDLLVEGKPRLKGYLRRKGRYLTFESCADGKKAVCQGGLRPDDSEAGLPE